MEASYAVRWVLSSIFEIRDLIRQARFARKSPNFETALDEKNDRAYSLITDNSSLERSVFDTHID